LCPSITNKEERGLQGLSTEPDRTHMNTKHLIHAIILWLIIYCKRRGS
jgi:hypothetical protein